MSVWGPINHIAFDSGMSRDRDELSYTSLEVACESLLTKLTKDKIYTYDKRKELKPCYYLDCCMMNRMELQCD